jgi:drug/metabolite transporter (DMT)-like permease
VSPLVLCALGMGAVLAATGQILLKQGATGRDALLDFVNVWIVAGLAAYGAGTLFWVFALSKAPLVAVYPFTVLTFTMVYVLAYFGFGEKLSLQGMAGVVLVLTGLVLIVRSS